MTLAKQLFKELALATTDTDRVDILGKLAFEFLNSDPDRCKETIDEMRALAEKTGYVTGLLDSYNASARLKFKQNAYEEALADFDTALGLAEQLDDLVRTATLLDSIGMVYWNKSEYEAAYEYYKKALYILNSIEGTQPLRANCLNNLGNVFERRGMLDEAEKSYRKSLDILIETNNTRIIGSVKGNLAIIKVYQKKFEDALQLFQECLTHFTTTNHKDGEISTLINIGRCHYMMKDYGDALKYFQLGLKTTTGEPAKRHKAEALHGLGDVYCALQGFDEALNYLKQSKDIYTKIGYISGVLKVEQSIARVYMEKGDHGLAKQILTEARDTAESKGIHIEVNHIDELLAELPQ